MRDLVRRYNVNVSINLDFVASALDAKVSTGEDFRSLLGREFELAISADLTPTVWLDLFIAAERETGLDQFEYALEEGFLTFLALPWELQARVGKFKTAFGKANLYHTHARPWIDVPAAMEFLLGEEGLVGYGLSINRLVPNPWDIYSELTFELFHAIHGSEIGGEEAQGTSALLHWKTFFDLNPSTTLELGLTGAVISQREGGAVTAEGLDATLKWIPADQSLYRSFTWQNELYAVQPDPNAGRVDNLWGAYSSAEYQFTRRLFGGLRLDWSEVPEGGEDLYAFVPFLTFRQTERIFWRLQYNHARNDPDHDGRDSRELRLQFNVSLGVHRPHAY